MTLNKTGPVSWSHLIKNSLHVAKILLWLNLKRSASMSVEANAEFCPSVWKLLPFFLIGRRIVSLFALTADAGREKRAGSEIGDKRNENIIFGSLILSHSNWLLHVELGPFFPPVLGESCIFSINSSKSVFFKCIPTSFVLRFVIFDQFLLTVCMIFKGWDLIDTLVPKFRTVNSSLKQNKMIETKAGLSGKMKKWHALLPSRWTRIAKINGNMN